MVMGNSIGKMEKYIKVTGRMVNNTEKVLLLIKMDKKYRENGLKEKK